MSYQLDDPIKAQITRGDFTNDSEYIRDLVRRDQEHNARFRALQDAIHDGLEMLGRGAVAHGRPHPINR